MVKLIVNGLNKDIGPGDIVGAFTNLVNIDADRIGKIYFKKRKAFVEVEDDIAKKVYKIMDGNQIGGCNVEITVEHSEKLLDQDLYEYINKYTYLVELEREEEMERHLQEIKRLSGKERQKRGRAILHLKGRDEGEGFAGKHLIKFLKKYSGRRLPETEIKVGDLVMLSKNNPRNPDNPTGTVVEKTRYSITVVFDNKPPSYLYKKGLRMDLFVNDITFQRMLTAIDGFKKAEGRLEELKQVLLGNRTPSFDKENKIDWHLKYLNSSQKKAVKSALAAENIFLIHGPPGTGKTVTCVEILIQAVKINENILAAADSNTAVDNLVERLVREGMNVVRVGHPARVTPLLREHTLDYQLEENELFKKAKKLRNSVSKLMDKQKRLTLPSGRWRRGMSNQQIVKLAENNRSSRGVPLTKIKEMAKWLDIQDKIDKIFKKVNNYEDSAVKELLNKADIVCATNSTAGSEILEPYQFDLAVVDEATQASEPSTLIPLVKSKKVVMAGDHEQLPPTILNKEASEKGLSISLFERLLDLFDEKIYSLLKVQYRMHNKIMNFSNEEFYNNQLEADESVAKQKLVELNIKIPEGETPPEKALRKAPVAFLDTKNLRTAERSRGDSNSFENKMEADIVRECVQTILKTGLNPEKIAVISPYKDQVELVSNKIKNKNKGLEIDTVDGFQGREKEIIIFSCVRSNKYGNIGFLRDLRRLNVAITRAKRRLILIGDSSTIASHTVYKKLIDYIKNEGFYYLF